MKNKGVTNFRIINILLNKFMRKRGIKYTFHFHSIPHIVGKETKIPYYYIEEVISIYDRIPLRMSEYDIIRKELIDCLNFILPNVECDYCYHVKSIKLITKHRIVSGVIL
jgi:hypothetical protein